MKQRYVVGFLKGFDNYVILVRKEQPAWQLGKLNGVGGKCEKNETAIDAMKREWAEETGGKLIVPEWRSFATVTGNGYLVYFYAAETPQDLFGFTHKNDVNEGIGAWPLAIHADLDTKMIDNLRWLIPLAFLDRAKPYAGVVDKLLPGEG